MRKMLLLILAITLSVCTSLSAGGSTEIPAPAYELFPKSLGFQYGEISGTGLSHHWEKSSVSYQVAAGGVYVPYVAGESYIGFTYPPTTLDYTIGGEIQFRVFGEAFIDWLTGQLYTMIP